MNAASSSPKRSPSPSPSPSPNPVLSEPYLSSSLDELPVPPSLYTVVLPGRHRGRVENYCGDDDDDLDLDHDDDDLEHGHDREDGYDVGDVDSSPTAVSRILAHLYTHSQHWACRHPVALEIALQSFDSWSAQSTQSLAQQCIRCPRCVSQLHQLWDRVLDERVFESEAIAAVRELVRGWMREEVVLVGLDQLHSLVSTGGSEGHKSRNDDGSDDDGGDIDHADDASEGTEDIRLARMIAGSVAGTLHVLASDSDLLRDPVEAMALVDRVGDVLDAVLFRATGQRRRQQSNPLRSSSAAVIVHFLFAPGADLSILPHLLMLHSRPRIAQWIRQELMNVSGGGSAASFPSSSSSSSRGRIAADVEVASRLRVQCVHAMMMRRATLVASDESVRFWRQLRQLLLLLPHSTMQTMHLQRHDLVANLLLRQFSLIPHVAPDTLAPYPAQLFAERLGCVTTFLSRCDARVWTSRVARTPLLSEVLAVSCRVQQPGVSRAISFVISFLHAYVQLVRLDELAHRAAVRHAVSYLQCVVAHAVPCDPGVWSGHLADDHRRVQRWNVQYNATVRRHVVPGVCSAAWVELLAMISQHATTAVLLARLWMPPVFVWMRLQRNRDERGREWRMEHRPDSLDAWWFSRIGANAMLNSTVVQLRDSARNTVATVIESCATEAALSLETLTDHLIAHPSVASAHHSASYPHEPRTLVWSTDVWQTMLRTDVLLRQPVFGGSGWVLLRILAACHVLVTVDCGRLAAQVAPNDTQSMRLLLSVQQIWAWLAEGLARLRRQVASLVNDREQRLHPLRLAEMCLPLTTAVDDLVRRHAVALFSTAAHAAASTTSSMLSSSALSSTASSSPSTSSSTSSSPSSSSSSSSSSVAPSLAERDVAVADWEARLLDVLGAYPDGRRTFQRMLWRTATAVAQHAACTDASAESMSFALPMLRVACRLGRQQNVPLQQTHRILWAVGLSALYQSIREHDACTDASGERFDGGGDGGGGRRGDGHTTHMTASSRGSPNSNKYSNNMAVLLGIMAELVDMKSDVVDARDALVPVLRWGLLFRVGRRLLPHMPRKLPAEWLTLVSAVLLLLAPDLGATVDALDADLKGLMMERHAVFRSADVAVVKRVRPRWMPGNLGMQWFANLGIKRKKSSSQ